MCMYTYIIMLSVFYLSLYIQLYMNMFYIMNLKKEQTA